MTQAEQLQFVSDLTDTIKTDVGAKIINGDIPEAWDGMELRQYLAERFGRCVWGAMSRKRKRDYNNTVMVNNL